MLCSEEQVAAVGGGSGGGNVIGAGTRVGARAGSGDSKEKGGSGSIATASTSSSSTTTTESKEAGTSSDVKISNNESTSTSIPASTSTITSTPITVPSPDPQSTTPKPNTTTSKDENGATTSTTTTNNSNNRVFVTAIFASLYHIPSTSNAILYVSKVDSTGQGARPSPTSTLVQAFLTYFAKPSLRPVRLRGSVSGSGSGSTTGINLGPGTTLWIHLFARAERQYLFPNSANHEQKKPLKDFQLCAWWRRVISQVVSDMARDEKKDGNTSVASEGGGREGRAVEEEDREQAKRAKLFYVLPGLEELEAIQKLGLPLVSPPRGPEGEKFEPRWIYGHPYSQSEIPLPCKVPGVIGGSGERNLGQLIPWFDDDPKSRFIDEIAYTTQVDGMGTYSPKRKRRRTTAVTEDGASANSTLGRTDENGREKEDGHQVHKEKEKETKKVLGELGKVSADEFWERMSFRQECVAGALTGFFVAVFPIRRDPTHGEGTAPDAGSRNQQELATGLNRKQDLGIDLELLKPAPGEVSHHLVQRVLDSLMMGCEFSTSERSVRTTGILEQSIRRLLCSGNGVGDDDSRHVSGREIRQVPEHLGVLTGVGHRVNDSEEEDKDRIEVDEMPKFLAPPVPRTPPRGSKGLPSVSDEVSPNPFPEPEVTVDTYTSFVYGSIEIDNRHLMRSGSSSLGHKTNASEAGGEVRVLSVRKKKRK